MSSYLEKMGDKCFAFGATQKRKTPQNVGFFLAGIGRIKKVPAIIGEN